MPLRAVLYQADVFAYGRKDHRSLDKFCGGGKAHSPYDNCQSDPPHFLISQTQNSHLADRKVCQLGPDNDTNMFLSPHYIERKWDHQKACPRRRRCLGSEMNEEIMRHQRLTHIQVERNRRRQVNEYLSVLRLLMPHSYADKGDQASIVGGAINFVKELEQKLQWLQSRKKTNSISKKDSSPQLPLPGFIISPSRITTTNIVDDYYCVRNPADVVVSMADSFASMKIRVTEPENKNRQLLRIILRYLDECKLTVLHLNMCTAEQGDVMYSICIKVEDQSKVSSGDEIASAMRQLLMSTIQDI